MKLESKHNLEFVSKLDANKARHKALSKAFTLQFLSKTYSFPSIPHKAVSMFAFPSSFHLELFCHRRLSRGRKAADIKKFFYVIHQLENSEIHQRPRSGGFGEESSKIPVTLSA
jgi:hypothetical protein